MAEWKLVDISKLEKAMKMTADIIRNITSMEEGIVWDEFTGFSSVIIDVYTAGLVEGQKHLSESDVVKAFAQIPRTKMDYLFFGLDIIELDLSEVDTKNIQSMKHFLEDCKNLVSLQFGENFIIKDDINLSGSHYLSKISVCNLINALDKEKFGTCWLSYQAIQNSFDNENEWLALIGKRPFWTFVIV